MMVQGCARCGSTTRAGSARWPAAARTARCRRRSAAAGRSRPTRAPTASSSTTTPTTAAPARCSTSSWHAAGCGRASSRSCASKARWASSADQHRPAAAHRPEYIYLLVNLHQTMPQRVPLIWCKYAVLICKSESTHTTRHPVSIFTCNEKLHMYSFVVHKQTKNVRI